MSKLSAFLKPVTVREEKEILISQRFVGEDGKTAPFRIRSITGAENDAIRASCTRKFKDKGVVCTDFDVEAYSKKLILACVAEPDFSAKELCDAYGTMDPQEVPGKMLLAGEMGRLSEEIMRLNGFDDDLHNEAKNF